MLVKVSIILPAPQCFFVQRKLLLFKSTQTQTSIFLCLYFFPRTALEDGIRFRRKASSFSNEIYCHSKEPTCFLFWTSGFYGNPKSSRRGRYPLPPPLPEWRGQTNPTLLCFFFRTKCVFANRGSQQVFPLDRGVLLEPEKHQKGGGAPTQPPPPPEKGSQTPTPLLQNSGRTRWW